METPKKKSKILPALVLFLLLPAGCFLAGGVIGKLTIAPGQGLAGAGIAAIYALGGAAVGLLLSTVLTAKLTAQRLWIAAGVALLFGGSMFAALRLIPKKTIETNYEPPPIFEPAFVFSLGVELNKDPSPDEQFDQPFTRLDVGTRPNSVRVFRHEPPACSNNLPAFDKLEALREQATRVRTACQADDEPCRATPCTNCREYHFLFYLDTEEHQTFKVSDHYLTTTPEGQQLVEALRSIYDEVQADWWCTG